MGMEISTFDPCMNNIQPAIHLMERIVDTDILFPGLVVFFCFFFTFKNSGNWNGPVLVKSLFLSAAL